MQLNIFPYIISAWINWGFALGKILVIEDEATVRENVVELLEDYGYESVGAANGREGVEKAKEILPELIVCDIMMPELDGYGVLKELQSDATTAGVPFIFLTAKAEKDLVRAGMNLGADDYLTKPFSPSQLFDAVDARIKRLKQIEEKSEKAFDDLRLSIASSLPHELRTPLNGVVGSSQFLMAYFDTLEKGEIQSLHKSIRDSAIRLQQLVTNYLFFAELELSKFDPQNIKKFRARSTPNAAEIIENAYLGKAVDYGRADDLTLEIENAAIMIFDAHLKKICEEIADNAFKFSTAGAQVIVNVAEKDDCVEVSTIDYGRGMSEEQISKVGAYAQFNRKIYEQQGSGLGLAIVKSAMDIYNGKMKIKSKVDDCTQVSLYLPTCKIL